MSNPIDEAQSLTFAKIKKISAVTIDEKRIRVTVEFDAAHAPLNLLLRLIDSHQQVLTSATLMGMTDQKVEFTLHNRSNDSTPPLQIAVQSRMTDDTAIESVSIPLEY